MFTGIIETLGHIAEARPEGGNVHFRVQSPISEELRVDQSVSHNGVCLTVTATGAGWHEVTAVAETLRKTDLGRWQEGSLVNLERCMKADGRFDGHVVQGHVDQTGEAVSVQEEGGSWLFAFRYDPAPGNLTVEKGSICVNGVSLTVVDSEDGAFKVAIIPYTYAHTAFKALRAGDTVNLEFDVIGKYVQRLLAAQTK